MKKFINKITNLLKKAKESNLFIISVAIISALSGGIVATYAENFIDSFLDTSRVADTWNVEVDTANGEVKLAQRACDNTVWFCDLAWRCPGLAGDGNGLLVKRANEASALQWKIWQTACDTPECGIDGGQDGDNLVADNTLDFSAYYPARQACKAVGGRLPTIAELQCIYAYRGSFGNNFNTGTTSHWSSTEYSVTDVRHVDFYNGGVGTYPKTVTRAVRCVRGW
ncbi:MAG: hypothetical protein ACWGHO_04170 [Candidatus Moraniibacteriota bacterium]